MPRKTSYSGKQKKKQLQEKKSRKQNGPKYLQDSDNEDDSTTPSPHDAPETQANGDMDTAADQPIRLPEKVPEVQRINFQPRPQTSSRLNANSFRLHFFKEDVQTINRRKKEARRPIKPVHEDFREWTLEDAYPNDAKLDFPKRPPWSYASSKEELEQREHKYFLEYVQEVLDQPRAQDLSFFELNLETWRQLWRVLEMSDILLVVADIRYPVLHIPPRLLTYVMNDLRKKAIVVLNKIDLVSPILALSWKRYLETKLPGLQVVFFSSNPREVSLGSGVDPASLLQKRPFHSKTLPVGPEELYKTVAALVNNAVDLSSWKQLLSNKFSQDSKTTVDTDKHDITEGKFEEISSVETLDKGVLTIGCVGYPNAGKSSVLNALVGKKVVSVSKSPGHTKHFQTIFLSPTVRLCDCPGLVFPSLVPKSLQVVAGIFPVSQVKEPYSVVGYLAKRLDLPKLLNIQPPNPSPRKRGSGEGVYQWSAYDICEAWAMKCGYTTSKAGRPDLYRAANKILRLAVEGQLCLCFYPPGFSTAAESLANNPDLESLAQSLCGKVREASEVRPTQDEDVESESEDASSGSTDGEEEELGDLETESRGMFERLTIQDDGESGDNGEDT
ncbi:guanine nucleotide-binding protein-like 1 [Elysia marginata]|uniref:Guanine nucleotide-binding protein-like 1 n=1 Tax=Elysia marginata TaxID=1093978 RepID=A0AAV4G0K2_9GAST|nr:guanine nucleotide-binding protein-like 1 [Elysia marginata]